MNNKETILTGIKNLKMQIKRLKTEVYALENVVGEMENSLDSEDTNVTCTDEPVLPKSLDFQEMKDLLDKLAEAGILKASYALKNQSWTERSELLHFCLEKYRESACGSLLQTCGIVTKVQWRVLTRSIVILKLQSFIIRNWSEVLGNTSW
ncbi:hypothetical protein KUA49_006650 [Segatella copri]|uniref:hypothetical protein n=1 Tax=Segatella copri TaxID=165179 RepID=UPI001C46A2CE|nr:hypothetical protein [Segatella copri]WOZ86048.1 hypothetical protein KUA49_006650 [Segatella copri]